MELRVVGVLVILYAVMGDEVSDGAAVYIDREQQLNIVNTNPNSEPEP